ncbi:MAG: hypothetical protein KAV00_08065, partial [Phycisphaerae bacterium]|nr:hypothetical protein [Phycisphaerae bacterium]
MNSVKQGSKVFLSVMVLAVTISASGSDAYGQEGQAMRDLQVVRKRLSESLLAASPKPDSAKIKEIAASLRPDGSWADIDYDDRGRTAWKTRLHLNRLGVMVRAYRSAGHAMCGDRDLKRSILSALDFWLTKDFRNPNWWWNKIGVPLNISAILVLMEGDISKTQRMAGTKILSRAKLGMVGQNLVWLAEITVARGCLEGDPEVVAEASKRMADEIRIKSEA